MSRMRIDPLTGEEFDADAFYRGPDGLWHNIEAERRFSEMCERRFMLKVERRNKSRVGRGLKARSAASYRKSASRYNEYLKLDCAMSFGEYLKSGLSRASLA